MTATETARLAEWLKAQGFTDAQVIQCINFIAYGQPKQEPEKKPENK